MGKGRLSKVSSGSSIIAVCLIAKGFVPCLAFSIAKETHRKPKVNMIAFPPEPDVSVLLLV